MRRIIAIGALTLVLLCGAVTAAAASLLSPRAPLIYTLPVYPNASRLFYSDSELRAVRASVIVAAFAPGGGTLSFETGAAPHDVLDYYDAWLTARGWSPQTYSQAQSQGTWQLGVYQQDGTPDLSRLQFLGFRGITPRFHIPGHHARIYINAHPVGNTTLVEIKALNIEY